MSKASLASKVVSLEAQIIAMSRELGKLKMQLGVPLERTHLKTGQPMKNLYVLYDFETGGLGKTSEIRVCQIGAIALNEQLERMDSFNEFVNPLQPMDMDAVQLHGIKDSFIRKFPDWSVVGNSFSDWVHAQRGCNEKVKVYMLAHNGKRFDSRILTYENQRHDIPTLANMFSVDTISIFKKLVPDAPDGKLGSIYKHLFHEAIPDQHTALADCEAMERIVGTADYKLVCDYVFKERESWDSVTKRCCA